MVTEGDTRTVFLDAFDEIQSAAAQKYAEDPAQKPKLAAWKTHDTTQTATISDKQQARQELNALLEDLAKTRRTIQRAANAQWPYHKVANRPIRAEFGLPKTRPLKA